MPTQGTSDVELLFSGVGASRRADIADAHGAGGSLAEYADLQPQPIYSYDALPSQ